jgi:hypothetical protein
MFDLIEVTGQQYRTAADLSRHHSPSLLLVVLCRAEVLVLVLAPLERFMLKGRMEIELGRQRGVLIPSRAPSSQVPQP